MDESIVLSQSDHRKFADNLLMYDHLKTFFSSLDVPFRVSIIAYSKYCLFSVFFFCKASTKDFSEMQHVQNLLFNVLLTVKIDYGK